MADAAADIEERGFSQTAKDLFSGAAGGIAQVLIGESHTSLFYSL
jgi:solute carrier family 25 carnitine/acylcarnitine transporter 20/29